MKNHYERSSKELEDAVNRGLAVARFNGLAAAARLMHEAAVPLTVAKRVLLRPECRRGTDWQIHART